MYTKIGGWGRGPGEAKSPRNTVGVQVHCTVPGTEYMSTGTGIMIQVERHKLLQYSGSITRILSSRVLSTCTL